MVQVYAQSDAEVLLMAKEDYIGEIPENRVLGAASRGLAGLKRGLNYIDLADIATAGHGIPALPKVDGPRHGAGDLLLGKTPEEVDAWAHGFSPFYENRGAFPQLRPNHFQGVLDTALLPVAEAKGLASLARTGMRKGVSALAGDVAKTGATDLERRNFVKKAAATAGAGAIASKVIPKLLEKDVAKGVEKAAPRVMTPAEYHAERAYAAHLADLEGNKAVAAIPEHHGFDHMHHYMEPEWVARNQENILDQIHHQNSAFEDYGEDIVSDEFDSGIRESERHDLAKDYIAQYAHADAREKAHAELLDKLHEKGRFPTHNELTGEFHVGELTDREYDQELRKQGWLPTENSWTANLDGGIGETIESRLRNGGKYTDPFSGNHALLDKNGDLVWSNGRDTARYDHWLHKSANDIRAEERAAREARFNRIQQGKKAKGGSIENTTHDRKMI